MSDAPGADHNGLPTSGGYIAGVFESQGRRLQPKVTVVTVVKNDLEGFLRTAGSLAQQSPRPDWIVMDGASEPEILDVLQTVVDDLGGQLRSSIDAGPYDAMNKALGLLDPNSYVWFMNAGDYFGSASCYSAVVNQLKTTGAEWLFGRSRVRDVAGNEYPSEPGRRYSVRRHAYLRTPICHQAVVARVAALRSAGNFDLSYPISADYKNLLALGSVHHPVQLEIDLAVYQAGGISDRDIRRNIKEQRLIRREIFGSSMTQSLFDSCFDGARLAKWYLLSRRRQRS